LGRTTVFGTAHWMPKFQWSLARVVENAEGSARVYRATGSVASHTGPRAVWFPHVAGRHDGTCATGIFNLLRRYAAAILRPARKTYHLVQGPTTVVNNSGEQPNLTCRGRVTQEAIYTSSHGWASCLGSVV
jgi:hypothetical protein